jgi:hypothetical protein
MEVKVPDADAIALQTLIDVRLYLPSQGLIKEEGRCKDKDQDQ